MDITQATRLVRSMVCEWGMTDTLGPVSYKRREDGNQFLGGPSFHENAYSPVTAEKIDQEVRKLLDDAYQNAKEIIEKNRPQVELMTAMLMEFETLDRDDVLEIMKGGFDAVKKRERLKLSKDLQCKLPPPPPAEVIDPVAPPSIGDNTAPQQI